MAFRKKSPKNKKTRRGGGGECGGGGGEGEALDGATGEHGGVGEGEVG